MQRIHKSDFKLISSGVYAAKPSAIINWKKVPKPFLDLFGKSYVIAVCSFAIAVFFLLRSTLNLVLHSFFISFNLTQGCFGGGYRENLIFKIVMVYNENLIFFNSA